MIGRTGLVSLIVCVTLCVGAAWVTAGTQYEYDALGRVVKATHDNGHSVTYSYDAAGNITSAQSTGRCRTSSTRPSSTMKKRISWRERRTRRSWAWSVLCM